MRRLGAAGIVLAMLLSTTAFADTTPSAGSPATPDAALVERSESGDAEAAYLLAEFYLKRKAAGDLGRAAGFFRRSIGLMDESYGSDNDTSVQLLDRLLAVLDEDDDREGLREASADRLNRLLRMHPDDVAVGHAWLNLGSAQSGLDRFAFALISHRAARRVFEAKLAEDPWNAIWAGATFFNEGLALRELDRPDEATTAFGEAARRYGDIFRAGTPELAAQAGDFLEPTLTNLIELAASRNDGAALLSRRKELVALLRATKAGSEELTVQLLELSKLHAAGKDPAAALTLLDEARSIRRALDAAPAAIASIDWERGIALFNMGHKRKALEAYLQAAGGLDPASENRDADTAGLWGNIADCFGDLKNFEQQRDALEKAVPALRRSRPGSATLADRLRNLADAQTATGLKREAVKTAEEEVAIRRTLQPGTLELGWALDGLARARLALNDFAGAAADFREATAAGAAADPQTKANAISTRVMLGIALYQDRRYDEAIAELDGALDWVETVEQPDKWNTSVALANLAMFNQQIGHYAQAEKAFNRQIAMLRDIKPGSADLAQALFSVSLLFHDLARFDEALPAMQEAIALRRTIDGEKSVFYLDALTQQGWNLEGAGRFDEALKLHADAVAATVAATGRQSLQYAVAISGHAWTLRRLNRFAEAEPEMEAALAIFEAKLGPAALNTGKASINLAVVKQRLGKNVESVRLGMRGLSIFDRDPRTTLEDQKWAYEGLSLAFRDMGDRKRAILFAKQGINVQQKLRSFNKEYSRDQMRGFREEWHRLYENLADMLIAEGRISEAQSVLAMEKEEELVNFIQRDAAADTRNTSAALTPREDTEKGRIDAIVAGPMADAAAVTRLVQKRDAGGLSPDETQTLSRLEGELDQAYAQFTDEVDAFLASAEAETAGVRNEVEAANLNYTADVQEELRAFHGDAVMLQIASLGETTHLFLTGPEASVHREVKIERAALARMVFEALDAVQNREAGADAKLRALFEVLVAPVAADLKASGAKTVMLNLQGFLRYVPFAALSDGKRYLVEDYALSLYTPAAKTEFRQADRAPDRSAGFGVTAAHPGFAALPGVAREIGAIFGGAGSRGALTGAANLDGKFTREAFQAALKGRPAIVHIASHFKLVPGRETDSFLLLGDGSSLSLADIRRGRNFRFGGVDLLTLSACETARGADGEGDEFESFGALAQMNGASSVMATLWPVADAETAKLMKSFYSHMMTPGISKAEALREAQLEAIRGDAAATAATADRGAASLVSGPPAQGSAGPSHPYFWSPFVLMGNWM